MGTSNRTIKWIENLAEQELSIRSGERVSFDIGTTKEEVLSVETATFARELCHHFEDMVGLFNQRVKESHLEIKLLRGSDRGDGFSLTRNRMRLVVQRRLPGTVQLQCEKLLPTDSFSSARTSVMFSGLIEARFGVFDDVEWVFLGSPVLPEQVARHYLTEFIQVSRATGE